MGILGAGKETFVASTVYNLAGDEDDRPDFLRHAVIGKTMAHTEPGMGEHLNQAYLRGPGIKLRSFARWSRVSGYNALLGLSPGDLNMGSDIDVEVLAGEIPHSAGSEIAITQATTGTADYTWWADQYMLEHHPTLIDTDYVTNFNETTNEISFLFEDLSTDSFIPVGYDKTGAYLYAAYHEHPPAGAPDPSWGPLEIFIYQLGSGNPTLDAMFGTPDEFGSFFPFIPMRLNNQFVGPDWYGDLYEQSKRAFRKATTGSWDKVVSTIQDNPSLDDIDYAYAVFGVTLNTKESASLRYIYELFQEIMLGAGMGAGGYLAWQAQYEEAVAAAELHTAWMTAQGEPSDPLFGTPEPPVVPYPPMPTYSLRLQSSGRDDLNFDMHMTWASVVESIGSGQKRPGAKAGDLWFDKVSVDEYPITVYDNSEGYSAGAILVESVRLNWQVDDDTWRALLIRDLKHSNKIYGAKTVNITAYQALDDPEDSGFIVPLHEEIYRKMPLVYATQMATACCYLVFNSYKVVKEQWYQTIAFKIIIVIIAIAVTIWAGGAGGAAAGGILGTNASIGAALGFAGTAALIAGAVANAIAAMIVVQIISMISTTAFGDKMGAIIAVIASIFVLNVGTAYMTGAGMASAFGNMMSAEGLMGLTVSTGNAYAGYMRASTEESVVRQQATLEELQRQSEDITKLSEQVFGGESAFALDPFELMAVTDTTRTEDTGGTSDTDGLPPNETPSTFLTRTLMTGTDIAGLSMDMLTNFAALTTNTDLPT